MSELSARRTEQVLRPPGWILGITLGTLALFAGLGAVSFRVPVPAWMRVAFVVLSLLSVAAIVEVLLCRVTLSDGGLEIVSNFRRRFIPRSDIESVTFEKGAPVSLRLVEGKWTHLPEVGAGSQAVTNSIRAWLKRTGA